MTTLTIADLDNGKRDLETVDAVANSTADNTTTRYGDTVLTLAGALRRLGYHVPTPYASGLNVSSALFTVSKDGVIYAPDPALVPFTTGAWNPAQWYPIQNTLADASLRVYPTLAAATAAVATLPNFVYVETVDTDKLYQKQSGALVEVKNYAAFRQSLATSAGAGMVGVTLPAATTVQDALTKSTASTRLKSLLDLATRDVYILLQGDSTGDEDWEWYRKSLESLMLLYPAHGFYYYKWDHDAGAWNTTVLRASTNGCIVRAYNGSYPGANPIYWRGARQVSAYDGWQFDLIISSYGLNTGNEWETQASVLSEHLMTLRQDQPKAEILVTIQPPDYTDANMLLRSQNRRDAQRAVAGAYGCRIVDAFGLFEKLVNADGVPAWYIDKIHPNAAGQLEWAALFTFQALNGGSTPVGGFIESLPSPLPNAQFLNWSAGSTAPPDYWAVSGGTVDLNSVLFETGVRAAKINGAGTGGTAVMYTDVTDVVDKNKAAPFLVFAARVYTTGTTARPGRIEFAHSASTAYTAMQSPTWLARDIHGGWRWVFLAVPRSFFAGKTDFRISIFGGESGEACTVDRITLGTSLKVADVGGTVFKRVSERSDSSHSVPTTGSHRTFNVPGIPIGAKVQVLLPAHPAGLVVSAAVTAAGSISVQYQSTTGTSIAVAAQTVRFEFFD